jgi:hypothetical protein
MPRSISNTTVYKHFKYATVASYKKKSNIHLIKLLKIVKCLEYYLTKGVPTLLPYLLGIEEG